MFLIYLRTFSAHPSKCVLTGPDILLREVHAYVLGLTVSRLGHRRGDLLHRQTHRLSEKNGRTTIWRYGATQWP